MFLIVGYNDEVCITSRNTNHQIKVLNGLSQAFKANFLYAECIWNIVYPDYCIIIYKYLCFGNLLISILFRSIVSAIKQLNSSNDRDAALLIMLNTMFADTLVPTQHFNACRCLQKIPELGHPSFLKIGISVCCAP